MNRGSERPCLRRGVNGGSRPRRGRGTISWTNPVLVAAAVQEIDLEPGVAVSVVGMLAEPPSEEPHVGLVPLVTGEDGSDARAHAVVDVERGPVVAEVDRCRSYRAQERSVGLSRGIAQAGNE